MSVKNCPICNKIFNDQDKMEVCAECTDMYENEFFKVKDFLYSYPNSSIVEVSQATGISMEKIGRFLRTGRIGYASNKKRH